MVANVTSAFSNTGVGTADLIIIIVYLAFCLAVGLWATWRTQRGSVSGYFLAGRDMLWFAVGASLFSSNIGSGSFVGLAGTGAANGIAVASYELNGLFCLLLLAWLFVPVYISSGVYTLPEYLKKRFGGQRLQVYMSVLALLIYIFTKISADIYAGSIFIQQAVGWNMYVGIIVLLVITAIYTVTGGLRAVIYTDTLQTVIMIGGALVLMALIQIKAPEYMKFELNLNGLLVTRQIDNTSLGGVPGGKLVPGSHKRCEFGHTVIRQFSSRDQRIMEVIPVPDSLWKETILYTPLLAEGFDKIGGMNKLYIDYPLAIPSTLVNDSDCGRPTDEAFHLLRNPTTSDLPWPGNVFGITILSAWYFCSDQVLVQRSLAAKNMHHVKGGSILAAYMKILPLFTTVFPGMISRILFKDQVACVDPDICEAVCENRAGCTNIAYPKLVVELMPLGLKGLMLAAMMAALMSSLTSVFNSSSTIFTMDIWKRVRPGAADGELLVVGRIFVLILVGISVVWIPVLQASQGGQLFNYIQSVTGYLAPPVLSLYLLAILWKRTNEQGAFWGLMIGLVVGLIRMGLDFGYGSPGCGEEDTRPVIISKIHFLHFTIILFFVSLFSTIIISVATTPTDSIHLRRLTWWTRHSQKERIPFEEELELENKAQVKIARRANKNEGIPKADLPGWKRTLFLICGYEPPKTGVDLSEEQKHEQTKLLTSIHEKTKWKWFVNINAIVLMTIGIFLWGYYA